MINKDKVILDLCGGTGAWSRPYQEAGYDVKLITLPKYDVTKVQFGNNAIEFIRQDVHYNDTLCVLYESVYGILAAPPCTEFSIAKNGSHRKRDLKEGMKTIRACLEIIWQCRLHGKPKFWAMENPRGLLRQFLGKPVITFDPWEYGDAWTKKTDIWGYFNPPRATVKIPPEGMTKRYSNGKSNAFAWTTCNDRVPEEYNGPKLDRAARRAITPSGFANAFFKANR